MENPIKMDDLGVPLFSETPILSIQSAFNLQKISIPWVQATVHISSCVCSEKMVARTFLEAVDKVKAAEGSAPKMTQPIETTPPQKKQRSFDY